MLMMTRPKLLLRLFIKISLILILILTFLLNLKAKNGDLISSNISDDVTDVAVYVNKQKGLLVVENKHLKDHIEQLNRDHVVFNANYLNVTSPGGLLVILVQVHKRIDYLKVLIESLKSVDRINQTLVVFSHDYYDTDINQLILNSLKDFCAFTQIFYPYSKQIYLNKFPGDDPKDCPPRITKLEAIKLQCNNLAYADTYGNYRDSQYVQIKHHWFWKISYVFEKFGFTKSITNLNVLLLEEDYYLMPDSLYLLNKLIEKVETPRDIISLAYFEKQKQSLEYETKASQYGRSYWISSNSNTGMYFTRSLWNTVKDCSNEFCTYDDYNWDWTLMKVGQSCLKSTFIAVVPLVSRVIHIGECGVHHKGKKCDTNERLKELQTIIKDKSQHFYPKSLVLGFDKKVMVKLSKPNGGWSDKRDHLLCKSFIDLYTSSNTTGNRSMQVF